MLGSRTADSQRGHVSTGLISHRVIPKIRCVNYLPASSGGLGHNGQVTSQDNDRAAPRVRCVGAVITDQAGRMLLIQRGHEPGKGLWSIPGGRIEPGETDQRALVREVFEETGLQVACGPLCGMVERPGLAGAILEIRDYQADVTGGALTPADDAAAARWVTAAEAAALDERAQLTGGLLEALRSWGALPGPGQVAGIPTG